MTMTESIMPCFVDLQAQKPRPEAIVLGHLLTGYGELEFEMCSCLGAVTGDINDAVRTVFKNRGAEQRIRIATKSMGEKFEEAGLANIFQETMKDMDWCREIRNQFAHCHWYTWTILGMEFVDLEYVAKQTTKARHFAHATKRIDLATLQKQEAFFKYVQKCFWNLTSSYQRWAGSTATHDPARPAKMAQPPKHS
jgi:hypothetical protein